MSLLHPTEAEELLEDLVTALENAFISSWQSTAGWSKERDAAREYLDNRRRQEDAIT